MRILRRLFPKKSSDFRVQRFAVSMSKQATDVEVKGNDVHLLAGNYSISAHTPRGFVIKHLHVDARCVIDLQKFFSK